jgi:hypothetical protein
VGQIDVAAALCRYLVHRLTDELAATKPAEKLIDTFLGFLLAYNIPGHTLKWNLPGPFSSAMPLA